MKETALKNTSEGRSYQTLRHLRTCAEPSLIPQVMVPASGEGRAGCAPPRWRSSKASADSSCSRKGRTSGSAAAEAEQGAEAIAASGLRTVGA